MKLNTMLNLDMNISKSFKSFSLDFKKWEIGRFEVVIDI